MITLTPPRHPGAEQTSAGPCRGLLLPPEGRCPALPVRAIGGGRGTGGGRGPRGGRSHGDPDASRVGDGGRRGGLREAEERAGWAALPLGVPPGLSPRRHGQRNHVRSPQPNLTFVVFSVGIIARFLSVICVGGWVREIENRERQTIERERETR